MSDGPRYATLRDYLKVLRERRRLVLAVTFVFAAVALGLSLAADPVYRSEASLAVRDIRQDLDFFGAPVVPRQTPQEQSTRTALRVEEPAIRRRVRRALGRVPPGLIEANVEATTNFVVVQATSNDARGAAVLANAYANQTLLEINRESRADFLRTAETLKRQRRSIPKGNDGVIQRAQNLDRISQLTFLARSSKPVELVEPARITSRPISPKPVRNALLGGVLGLTLGLLAAFVRDSLDRRLRGSREIQAELNWPVLGHIRDEAMGQAGFVTPNGDGGSDEADLEAFRILRANLRYLDIDHPPTTVAVTSALPEEGKSTVASQLACASAVAGRRTLLVECDLRRPSLPARLGVEAAPGLSDYLLGEANPPEILRQVPIDAAGTVQNGEHATTPASLVYIPAGSYTPNPAELLGSQRFSAFLVQVAAAYELVVLDTSPLLSVGDTLEIIPHVDAVLACVRAGQSTREEVKAMRAALDRFPPRPTGVIVTGVRHGDESDFGYYSYTYAYGPVTERV